MFEINDNEHELYAETWDNDNTLCNLKKHNDEKDGINDSKIGYI